MKVKYTSDEGISVVHGGTAEPRFYILLGNTVDFEIELTYEEARTLESKLNQATEDHLRMVDSQEEI